MGREQKCRDQFKKKEARTLGNKDGEWISEVLRK